MYSASQTTRLAEEQHRLASHRAQQVASMWHVDGVQPGWAPTHFAGKAVAQQLCRVLRRLSKAQQPVLQAPSKSACVLQTVSGMHPVATRRSM